MKLLQIPGTLALATVLVAVLAAIVIVGTAPSEGVTAAVAELSAAPTLISALNSALTPAPSR
jgi:hypothetical protein